MFVDIFKKSMQKNTQNKIIFYTRHTIKMTVTFRYPSKEENYVVQ